MAMATSFAQVGDATWSQSLNSSPCDREAQDRQEKLLPFVEWSQVLEKIKVRHASGSYGQFS